MWSNLIGVAALLLIQSPDFVGGYIGPNYDSAGPGVGLSNTGPNIGATGNVTLEATGEKNWDTAPRWLRQLPPRRVGAVFPTKAYQLGRSGEAKVKCTLTAESALSGCSVISETAGGLGFGQAALTLLPDLNINPATKRGRPVASEVTLTAHFIAPSAVAGTYVTGVNTNLLQRYLTDPVWERAPSYSQVAAAYPVRARDAKKSGRVSLDCVLGADGRFDGCVVMNEEPAGYGFGAAAMQLAREFKTVQTLPSGASVRGGVVKVPFTFSTALLTPGAMVTGSPTLTAIPSNQDLARAFPRAARVAGIGQARSALECTVAANGYLTNCRVVTEAPAGYNVAVGAMDLASKYRVSPWSSDGLPVVGSRVRVPINYNLAAR